MFYALLIAIQLVQVVLVYLHYRHHVAKSPLRKAQLKTIEDLAIYPDKENNRILVSFQIGMKTSPVVSINLDEHTLDQKPHYYAIGVIRDIVTKGLPPFEF